MQMVAAAKLRRAQDAAEASRPYSERFNSVLASLAASVGSSESAPLLLRGTGKQMSLAGSHDSGAWFMWRL
jgi:F-type H+-transporting ATPase subunit gamma